MATARRSDSIGQYRIIQLIEAQLLPTVETTIIDETVDVLSIVISNAGGAAAPTFTIKDKQSTPREFVFGANTPVGTGIAVSFQKIDGARATGGLTWVQDSAGELVGRIEYLEI